MTPVDFSGIVSAHPAAAETVAALASLNVEVSQVHLEPFHEPISATTLVDGKPRLLNVGAAELTAWVQHVGQGTHCRLRALEEPVVRSLSAGRIVAALALLRSHVEAAALAAHCLEQLTLASRTRATKDLAELIARTLFGTSMQRHRHHPPIADLLAAFEGDTIRITRAVESLDRYYYQEHSDGTFVRAYSLLCEYAHPNHRGIMHMMSSEERDAGWTISYRAEEPHDSTIVVKALEILLVSMRAGHSAVELLRCWRFQDADEGPIWNGPAVSDAARAWRCFLQRPPDAS